MSKESRPPQPHFGSGHMCGYCPLSSRLHVGCFAGGNARVVEREVQVYQGSRVELENIKVGIVKNVGDSPDIKP